MRALPPDVTSWLAAARAGSSEALGQALESCREPLLHLAEQELDDPRLRPKASPSDLVQHTLLEAHQDFGNFRGRTAGQLLKWLRRLLRNNVSNFRRLYRKSKRRVDREIRIRTGSADSGAGSLPAKTPSPSSEAIHHEQTDLVKQALDRLPHEYRRVIVLRYREERSFAEIGQIMGRTVNGAQKLWVRATQLLRTELEEFR